MLNISSRQKLTVAIAVLGLFLIAEGIAFSASSGLFGPIVIGPPPPGNTLPVITPIFHKTSGVVSGSLSNTSLPVSIGGSNILTDGDQFGNFKKIWNPWWSGEFGVETILNFNTQTSAVNFSYSIP